KVPSLTDVYKMLTTQRSLTKEEEEAYLKIDNLLKKSPERMKINDNEELTSIIQSIEETGLEVALRKENDFPYYSEGLTEKSLKVHSLDYELNNFKPGRGIPPQPV
ncbi:sensor histidine kinase, partial [Salmonella enterica subsp. enterica serovar Kentucky]|nr:sensor histidine kinase [Salmonella enterica subsp. enterica serovar Kentucky]